MVDKTLVDSTFVHSSDDDAGGTNAFVSASSASQNSSADSDSGSANSDDASTSTSPTELVAKTESLAAALVAAPAAPLILGVSPISGPATSLATIANVLTLSGLAAAGLTVTVYDGATSLGAVTANAQGDWSFTTSAPLSDGVHAFSATATASSLTSAQSAATDVTVKSDIGSFSALTDQWSAPISVGGSSYYVENANVNGNAPWAISEVNDHTLQFTLKPGDLWPDNASSRSEIAGGTLYAANSVVNVSYQVTVQPGLADPGLDWEILGQMHADDNSSIVASLSSDYPILAFHLTGADGQGGGDYLAIQAFYLPSGANNPVAATSDVADNGYLYVSSQPIVRGSAYSVQVEGSFQDNANGFLDVWINGVQVVDYHGPLGYGTSNYWKEGVYEGYTQTQPITVDYANTTVTSTPNAPVIAESVVNGDQAIIGGTAEAYSTASVYNGATLLGSTTTASNGDWSYETGALTVGAHSFTATATDAAGKVSFASIASSATIASLTELIVKSATASAVSGEALVGQKITFTLAMSSAATVAGAPSLTLSNGGSATYLAGSGTSTLTFQYVVAAGDSSTSGLTITGVALQTGASIKGSTGNAAVLMGADQTFGNIVVDTAPVSAPVFVSSVANANGSITVHGTAAPNTIVHEIQQVFTSGNALNLDGTAVVSASGAWTYTTPSLPNGTWQSLSAYDTNSLGDVSATTTNNGDSVSTKELPSPVILSNDLSGNLVTLSGVIPSNYGSTGPSGATVLIFDGLTRIGSATTTTGGAFTFTTQALSNGTHSFSVESQNASGASAASIPVSITIGQASTVVTGGPVTVADYLANQAALDAAGSVTISDTPAAVASAIDTINADTHVSAISLLGGAQLDLSAAQALGDTHALNAITNSSYGVTITDTGADISAEFDALNSDAHVTLILPAGGSQTLVLTVDQMLSDTHAISLLDPFTITVVDTAADLDALSTAQIAEFAADGVTELDATNADLSLALAQRESLGSEGISALQPYSGGGTETITYHPGGGLSTILYQGLTGRSYTSVAITYGANGKPASALYNTGVTETWTYNADGSYSVHYSDVAGQAYTSYSVNYGTNGRPTNAAYSNGATVTWSYNADGSLVVTSDGITGRSFTSEKALYNSAGALVATATDQSSGAGVLTLFASGLTVSDSDDSLAVTVGADTFALDPLRRETVNATGFGSERFNYAFGFGHQTISGFKAGGSGGDTLSLGLSMFTGLSILNTVAADAAVLLSSGAMAQSGSAVTITDVRGETITLEGQTTTTLIQSASSVFKFA